MRSLLQFNIQLSIINLCDFHIARNGLREKFSGGVIEATLKENTVSKAPAMIRPQWRIVRLCLLS
jgi:hypothetical protein